MNYLSSRCVGAVFQLVLKTAGVWPLDSDQGLTGVFKEEENLLFMLIWALHPQREVGP